MPSLDRSLILPEAKLPDVNELISEGKHLSKTVTVGSCPFLVKYDVQSESEYKRQRMRKGEIMLHGQLGFRSLAKSQRAYLEIYNEVAKEGYRVDRYGICLDWSMGYPTSQRTKMPKGTGLILKKPEDFIKLTHSAPVAPHFGDFVIGTPASIENTIGALKAGATSIGNIGQYFTFRMPMWNDDITTTAETIKALALCAAQPVEIMIHSNLDDGFAALFCDMTCSIGMVLLERYIIEELIGGSITHCYGHTFSEPLTRLGFQRALAKVMKTPGSMVYGNTTIYGVNEAENYANLASYLLVDIIAQHNLPTGHGINPVPVSEATHIPEIKEIIEAQLFANRLILRAEGYQVLFDFESADNLASKLVAAGQRFKKQVLMGLNEAGIDMINPFELLLALRRIGAKRLEELFGPGKPQKNQLRKRNPVVRATTLNELELKAEKIVASLNQIDKNKLHHMGFTICIACTDVHEYGKLLLENVIRRLKLNIIDGGVSVDPDIVAKRANEGNADFIAISTYNGIALSYYQALLKEISNIGINIPIFIGGKLNQIPEDTQTSIPVDVTEQLRTMSANVCHHIEDMIEILVKEYVK